jgi:predicted RND superfamily exporter protein
MWRSLGQFILKYRLFILLILAVLTGFMTYHATRTELSYEFGRAIPTDHPKYKAYQNFKKKFGEDGNLLVIGIQTDKLFQEKIFNDYIRLQKNLKKISGVEDIISASAAINLVKDSATERLKTQPIFRDEILSQSEIDSSKNIFLSLPFYQTILYNPATNAWLIGVRINKDLMNSKSRMGVVRSITEEAKAFGARNNIVIHLSGLPLIRTEMANRISKEMKWFLVASVVLSALILLLFFKSVGTMFLSLGVVIIGVLFSLGSMHLLHYKINLLTALIPPLIVVIGIPNCIYFLNKFHTSYNDTGDKKKALVEMVSRMGIVTLFCNLTAAIGFAVFALTRSDLLKEFGVVAGINIILLFFISLFLIPSVLSYLPAPKNKHTKYLENVSLNRWLDRLERWTLNHRRLIYAITVVVVAVAFVGIFKLKTVGYIVDDLPKTDKIYTDLKFFESNFKGVMPLEIIVDTKRKYGVTKNFANLQKIDSFSQYISTIPGIARPLSIAEGLKFVRQALFEGDSGSYAMPGEIDLPALAGYLNFKNDSSKNNNSFSKLISSFMDTAKQQARISVNMADVGSARLPHILDSIQEKAEFMFNRDSIVALSANAATKASHKKDSTWGKRKFDITLTGTSVTFLEGSNFIIHGLQDSIIWAFVLIAICMLYLFRSFRILICSLIPNIIPLLITAGVMGWTGVPLKPSTVLIFSVALGIAIDVTIRFLVNYKQELPAHNKDPKTTVIETIHNTGISIIYTSLVLIAGFVIFCFSGFGGTRSLGWFTSLTLITATFTNLVLLPAILISVGKLKKK